MSFYIELTKKVSARGLKWILANKAKTMKLIFQGVSIDYMIKYVESNIY